MGSRIKSMPFRHTKFSPRWSLAISGNTLFTAVRFGRFKETEHAAVRSPEKNMANDIELNIGVFQEQTLASCGGGVWGFDEVLESKKELLEGLMFFLLRAKYSNLQVAFIRFKGQVLSVVQKKMMEFSTNPLWSNFWLPNADSQRRFAVGAGAAPAVQAPWDTRMRRPSKECVKNAKQSTMEVGRAPKVCCVILSDQVLPIILSSSNVQLPPWREVFVFNLRLKRDIGWTFWFVFDIPPFCPCLLTLPFQTTAATSIGLPFLHISSLKTAVGLGSGAQPKKEKRPEIVTIEAPEERGVEDYSWVVVSDIFLFLSLFGEDSHFDQYFSIGLKPPTSYSWLPK